MPTQIDVPHTAGDEPAAETVTPVPSTSGDEAPAAEPGAVLADLLVEDVSIDGMCGVY